MVRFEAGEFEIAVVTYKRQEFVRNWLDKCYEPAVARSILLSVYDSSPDDGTEKMIDSFNEGRAVKVQYHHVDEKTIIGYKPMLPILNTTSTYIWVSGDSRYQDFNELDEKLFPMIKSRDIDYAVIDIGNIHPRPDMVFDDKGKMIHTCFVAMTCIGMSIYRTAIFDIIRNTPSLLEQYDKRFGSNYGFAWLGYFYNAYAAGEYRAALVNAGTKSILKKEKVQSWAVRFYGCWAEDLCQIIDSIPDSYADKDSIPKETWDVMKLDSISFGYKARKYGDLDAEKYAELKKRGIIAKLTDKPGRIKFFATAPMPVIECVNGVYGAACFVRRAGRKVVEAIKGRNSR